MFRHGNASTEVDKKPFIFTLTGFLSCLAAAVLIIALGKGDALSVFAGIMLGIAAIAGGLVLFAMVTDRAYVEGDTLVMRYLFRFRRVPVKDIGKITYRDDVYSVYDRKGNLLGTVNGKLTGIGTVLYELDKQGVSFV